MSQRRKLLRYEERLGKVQRTDFDFWYDKKETEKYNNYTHRKLIKRYSKMKGKSQDYVVQLTHIGCCVKNCSCCKGGRKRQKQYWNTKKESKRLKKFQVNFDY